MTQNEQGIPLGTSADWEELYAQTTQRHFEKAKTLRLERGGYNWTTYRNVDPIPGVLPAIALGKKLVKIGDTKMEVEDFVGSVLFCYEKPVGDRPFAQARIKIYSGINGVIEDTRYDPPRDIIRYKESVPAREFVAHTPDELQNLLEELYPRSILEGTCGRGDQMNRKLIKECSLTHTLAKTSFKAEFATAQRIFQKGDEYIFTDLEMKAYNEGITQAFKLRIDSTHQQNMSAIDYYYRTCVSDAEIKRVNEERRKEGKRLLNHEEIQEIRRGGETSFDGRRRSL